MSHRTALLTIALAATALAGCIHSDHHPTDPQPGHGSAEPGHGPPPQAPAHGYRHRQETNLGGIDMVFDSDLGVYVVVDWPDHYWHRDYYYRWVDGGWMMSRQIDSRWIACSTSRVPVKLVKKHARQGKKGLWSHPASH